MCGRPGKVKGGTISPSIRLGGEEEEANVGALARVLRLSPHGTGGEGAASRPAGAIGLGEAKEIQPESSSFSPPHFLRIWVWSASISPAPESATIRSPRDRASKAWIVGGSPSLPLLLLRLFLPRSPLRPIWSRQVGLVIARAFSSVLFDL